VKVCHCHQRKTKSVRATKKRSLRITQSKPRRKHDANSGHGFYSAGKQPAVSICAAAPAAASLPSSKQTRMSHHFRAAGASKAAVPNGQPSGTSFAADMGYCVIGGWLPGASVFRRDGSTILRVADSGFDPTDDFCTVWRLFDLLPEVPVAGSRNS
jgi:hypothetical protein